MDLFYNLMSCNRFCIVCSTNLWWISSKHGHIGAHKVTTATIHTPSAFIYIYLCVGSQQRLNVMPLGCVLFRFNISSSCGWEGQFTCRLRLKKPISNINLNYNCHQFRANSNVLLIVFITISACSLYTGQLLIGLTHLVYW